MPLCRPTLGNALSDAPLSMPVVKIRYFRPGHGTVSLINVGQLTDLAIPHTASRRQEHPHDQYLTPPEADDTSTVSWCRSYDRGLVIVPDLFCRLCFVVAVARLSRMLLFQELHWTRRMGVGCILYRSPAHRGSLSSIVGRHYHAQRYVYVSCARAAGVDDPKGFKNVAGATNESRRKVGIPICLNCHQSIMITAGSRPDNRYEALALEA
jgi:hypothetical protein